MQRRGIVVDNLPILGVDSAVLANWFNARLNTRATAALPPRVNQTPQVDPNSARGPTDTVPPWDVTAEQKTADEKLRTALSADRFINEEDASLGGDNVHADHRKLFALYQGVSMLQTIAKHAAAEGTSELLLKGLDRQFQEGMSEVLSYIDNFESDEFELAAGEKQKRADSEVAVERKLSEYTGKIAHRAAITEPLANITGTERFAMSVVKGGATTTVDFDLSEIAGDLTIDNVVDYVNGKLETAGVITRLDRVRVGEKIPMGTGISTLIRTHLPLW